MKFRHALLLSALMGVGCYDGSGALIDAGEDSAGVDAQDSGARPTDAAVSLDAETSADVTVPPDAAGPTDEGVVDAIPPDMPLVGCADDTDCDDGLFCNGTEICVGARAGLRGVCVFGDPIVIDDGVPCTVDHCDEEIDTVRHTPDHARCDPHACGGVLRCDAVEGCVTEDADGDGVSITDGDCDDCDPNRRPGRADLVRNEIDEDCDGVVDEGCDPDDCPDGERCVGDQDGDGVSVADGDCDDCDPRRRPGHADLVGDEIDEDCDGVVDEGCATDGCPDGERCADRICVPDPCALALPLAADVRVEIDFEGGPPGPYAGSCGGANSHETVFEFIAPEAGQWCLNTAGSRSSTVMYVRAEGCDGEEIACNNRPDEHFRRARIVVEAEANERFMVFIDSPGDFGLSATAGPCALSTPSVGSLAITEVHHSPSAVSNAQGEWFEVYNRTELALELQGMQVVGSDLGEGFVVEEPLTIAPGTWLVFARNGDVETNGGVVSDYAYGNGLRLGNETERLRLLTARGSVIDEIEYDGGRLWPDPVGASMQLDGVAPGLELRHLDRNHDGARWCAARLPYGAGDLGTPGAPNPPCPFPEPGALMITEIMVRPDAVPDSDGEWFEIRNFSDEALSLRGLRVSDDNFQSIAIVEGELMIEPGQLWVMARNGDVESNGGVEADFVYGDAVVLPNRSGFISLGSPRGVRIDSVQDERAFGFPLVDGAAMQFDRQLGLENSDARNWCLATDPYGAGDLGTPGVENPRCR
jgi:hypothetical protein